MDSGKSKRIDPKQCVQILDLHRLLRISQARENFAKVRSQLLPLSQLPVAFLLVFRMNVALGFFFIGLSITEQERTVGKILVSSMTWSYPFALYFYGEVVTNRNMT